MNFLTRKDNIAFALYIKRRTPGVGVHLLLQGLNLNKLRRCPLGDDTNQIPRL